jgi:hypothetical protein
MMQECNSCKPEMQCGNAEKIRHAGKPPGRHEEHMATKWERERINFLDP